MLHNVYYTLQGVHCSIFTAHFAYCTELWTLQLYTALNTKLWTMNTELWTMNTAHSTVHCSVRTVVCTLQATSPLSGRHHPTGDKVDNKSRKFQNLNKCSFSRWQVTWSNDPVRLEQFVIMSHDNVWTALWGPKYEEKKSHSTAIGNL